MKTCEEWWLAFNQYYNNISSNKAPGLEPVEISRVLTDAQYSVVIGLYNGTLGSPFESTEQNTEYLSPLMAQETLCKCSEVTCYQRVSEESVLYELPDDLLFVTLELCYVKDPKCGNSKGEKQVDIVPVTQDDYWRTIRDPFKRQNDNRVLRLTMGETMPNAGDAHHIRYSELLSKNEIARYIVRYIRRPEPIILEDLAGYGLSIDGKTDKQPCLLPEALHQVILTTAVKIAKDAWNN